MAINAIGSQTVSSPVLPGGYTNSSITTSTARPYSLATMDVDTGLTIDAINRTMQIESTLPSVFVDLGAEVVYSGEKMTLPDAIIVTVRSEKGARTQSFPQEKPLPGAARYGTDQDLRGYERQRVLAYQKIYYNEYCYGVMGETFGMNFNDLDVINYYKNEQPAVSKWYAEDKDKQIHEALFERYGYVLEGTGTALEQNYNPNIYIANTDYADMPTYSNDTSTYRTNINTALAAADTGTNGVNANIDLDMLIELNEWAAKNKRIEKVMVGGKESYVLLLPSTQYNKLLRVTNGQLGAVWEQVNMLSGEEQRFPGIVGRVMDLVIIKDPRTPTLTCTNDYGNNTHSVVYMEPGNYDLRNTAVYDESSNASWDVGFLLGKGAVIDWLVTDIHWEKEEDEYTKRYGKGIFCERGFQLGNCYDTDTASNLNLQNFGSAAVLFTAANAVVTA